MALAPALAPARWADFDVGELLGRGATSRVFAAVDRRSGAEVVLKTLEQGTSRSTAERFAREAWFLSTVDSRHVCKLHGFGHEGGRPFLVLERLVGETLAARLERDGTVPLASLAAFVRHVLLGLAACHDAQMVHRDLKPSNVFVARPRAPGAGARASLGEEAAKIIDFGLGRFADRGLTGKSVTSNHHLLGSVGYMPPEQLDDPRTVGPAADLYAVGVLLHRAALGELPFLAPSVPQVVERKRKDPPPRPFGPMGLPGGERLDDWLGKALAPSPHARFRSAREMLAAFDGALEDDEAAPTTLETGPPSFGSVRWLASEPELAPDDAGSDEARTSPLGHPAVGGSRPRHDR